MVGFPENEQALIQTARRGNSQAALDAFNALVLRYQDNVYAVAYRIMGDPAGASDITQEVFIIAYRRLNTYHGGSFKSWLLRITTNHCYDELRRVKRRPAVSVEELPGADTDDGAALIDPSQTPEQVADQNELQRAIQECITALNPDQRVVLVMSDVEGMEYAVIADSLGINLGTVKSRLSRARAGVRDCLRAVEELLPSSFRLKRNDSVL
jgi:RNA polymerase sigma-70 factor (ECF subfamily)